MWYCFVMTENAPNHSPEQPYVRSEADKQRLIEQTRFLDWGGAEGLYSILEDLGTITGSKGDYSAKELISIIDRVKAGELGLEYVTSTYGLRETVERLLQEKAKGRPLPSQTASVQLPDPRRKG